MDKFNATVKKLNRSTSLLQNKQNHYASTLRCVVWKLLHS